MIFAGRKPTAEVVGAVTTIIYPINVWWNRNPSLHNLVVITEYNNIILV